MGSGMMENNTKVWLDVCRVPVSSLKAITGGRLKGKSDINPQWRFLVMTQVFGMCGIGWKYTIDKQWLEEGKDGEVMAFVNVSLYVKHEGVWSDAIQGNGGAMLIAKEKSGYFNSDEAYKMAMTDALSVSMKALGVAGDIYMGIFDGSKYMGHPANIKPEQPQQPPTVSRLSSAERELCVKDMKASPDLSALQQAVKDAHALAKSIGDKESITFFNECYKSCESAFKEPFLHDDNDYANDGSGRAR